MEFIRLTPTARTWHTRRENLRDSTTMIFNSLVFLFFFIFVLCFYFLPLGWRARKSFLLLASLFFYGAWRPEYLIIILFSTLVDWFIGKKIGALEDGVPRKVLFCISLCSNLGLLAFFKYGNFFLDNVNVVMATILKHEPVEHFDILLPVGISFYTFQTLSYTIDIYRRTMKPWKSFLDFGLFVTFFPQLVAGPIVRAVDFEPQCAHPPVIEWRTFCWGFVLAVLGMFQKIVLSDSMLAPAADAVYASTKEPGFTDAWLGTLAFSGQIYFDFAGYSICAIGVALMLGFSLPDNFKSPYGARGFSDFWKRWHISLSSWLRDYLYISLGGNRKGPGRTQFNLFMTMVLGGLWHGASWNFVLWGMMHGSYLILERHLQPIMARHAFLKGRTGRWAGWILTYLLVCLAWVPFRATDLKSTWLIFCGMFGMNQATHAFSSLSMLFDVVVLVPVMVVLHYAKREHTLEEITGRLPWWLVAIVLAFMIFLTVTNIGTARAFIYFQF